MRILFICIAFIALLLAACNKPQPQPAPQPAQEDVVTAPIAPEPVPMAVSATPAAEASPTNAAPAATELVH